MLGFYSLFFVVANRRGENMGGGRGRRGLPLHREATDGRAPAAQGWPCFGAGESALGGRRETPFPAPAPHPTRGGKHRRSAPNAALGARCQRRPRVSALRCFSAFFAWLWRRRVIRRRRDSTTSDEILPHVQSVTTDHPIPRSARRTPRSRCVFRRIFFSQNKRFVFGIVARAHPLCACQKQPLTKNATFLRLKTASGVPGISVT